MPSLHVPSLDETTIATGLLTNKLNDTHLTDEVTIKSPKFVQSDLSVKRHIDVDALKSRLMIDFPPSEAAFLGVATRILFNMSASVSDDVFDITKESASRLFKRPLPFDDANPLKRTLMMELMEPAGNDPISIDVWAALESSFDASVQSTPFVLRTGVSGLGKTKAAYDVGLQHAFVVMCRIIEKDELTMPWVMWRRYMKIICDFHSSDLSSLASCAKAAMLILITCHIRWATRVSEVALSERVKDAFNLAETRIREFSRGYSSESDAATVRERVLREIVLRCQRNGLAHEQVAFMFCEEMNKLTSSGKVFSSDGSLILKEDYAYKLLKSVTTDAMKLWGGNRDFAKIVFVYDEVQGLLTHFHDLPQELFNNDGGLSNFTPRGCFYGLLWAMRAIFLNITSGHLLLSPNFDLADSFENEHSPAQGRCKTLSSPVTLTTPKIKKWFSSYLTEEAIGGLDDDLIEKLSGRGLFSSFFWSSLLVWARNTAVGPTFDPKTVVKNALDDAYKEAVEAVSRMVVQLWNRHEPGRSTNQIPNRLIRWLFFNLVMDANVPINRNDEKHRKDLIECIVRGILNASPEHDILLEPALKAALIDVGMKRLSTRRDEIMMLLAGRMHEPAGGEVADYGPSQENCVAWALVRRCLLHNSSEPMTVGRLLKPWLVDSNSLTALNDETVLPSVLEQYEVKLQSGLYWEGEVKRGNKLVSEPLGLLKDNPHVLLHHPPSWMGGPDIVFLATNPETKATKLVLMQLKNVRIGKFEKVLSSLQKEKWCKKSEKEQKAFMTLLKENAWEEPIRVIVNAQGYDSELLLASAWLNQFKTPISPCLLLRVEKSNLGVEISAPGAAESCLKLTQGIKDALCLDFDFTQVSMRVQLSFSSEWENVWAEVTKNDDGASLVRKSRRFLSKPTAIVKLTNVALLFKWLKYGFIVNNKSVIVTSSPDSK